MFSFLPASPASRQRSLFRTFTPKDLHTLLPIYLGNHEVRKGFPEIRPSLDPSLAGGFHWFTCPPRFVRHLEEGGHSDPPFESLHSLSPLCQTPHLSPGTWEVFTLVVCRMLLSDRVARTSLVFQSFGPGMRRVDSDLTAGTHLWVTRQDFLLFPSSTYAILLTFLSTPDCPCRSRVLYTPFSRVLMDTSIQALCSAFISITEIH